MPRKAQGAHLQLFGPDRKYGAWPKKNLSTYRWFILDRVDGQRIERGTGCELADREHANAALAEYEREKKANASRAGDEGLTVRAALALYGRDHLQAERKPGLKGFLARAPFLDEELGRVTIGELSADHVAKYITWRQERGVLDPRGSRLRDLKSSTLRRELTDLRSALKFCHTHGHTSHPCPAFPLPAETQGTYRWLTHSEAAAVMCAARSIAEARWHLPLFINISLWTAQRKSAVLGLRWEPNSEGGHVDMARGEMHFPPEGRAQTKKRKTRCMIPARCMALLRIAHARRNTYVIERAGRPNERLSDIKKAFDGACRRAGIEMEGQKRVTPHTLGHTSITWMLERGVTIRAVSLFTGKSEQVIRDRYGHHSDDLLADIVRGR